MLPPAPPPEAEWIPGVDPGSGSLTSKKRQVGREPSRWCWARTWEAVRLWQRLSTSFPKRSEDTCARRVTAGSTGSHPRITPPDPCPGDPAHLGVDAEVLAGAQRQPQERHLLPQLLLVEIHQLPQLLDHLRRPRSGGSLGIWSPPSPRSAPPHLLDLRHRAGAVDEFGDIQRPGLGREAMRGIGGDWGGSAGIRWDQAPALTRW